MSGPRIRIALVELLPLLRGIVEEVISAQPDMEVVPQDSRMMKLASIDEADPDVVILGREDTSLTSRLLRMRPNLKVLAVAMDGREGVLFELRPRRVDLGEISPQKLVNVIRETTKAPGAWTAVSWMGDETT